MIYGTGVDLIEVKRIREVAEQDIGFIDKIFTKSEIEYCESKWNKYYHFAARYTAKEAYLKAFGTGWRYGIQYSDIDINNDELGKPLIRLHGKAKELAEEQGVTRIHLTLSHLKELAIAMVIIETK